MTLGEAFQVLSLVMAAVIIGCFVDAARRRRCERKQRDSEPAGFVAPKPIVPPPFRTCGSCAHFDAGAKHCELMGSATEHGDRCDGWVAR